MTGGTTQIVLIPALLCGEALYAPVIERLGDKMASHPSERCGLAPIRSDFIFTSHFMSLDERGRVNPNSYRSHGV
jgi:hypothetical protein